MCAIFRILTCTVSTPEQAEEAVRHLRHAAAGAGEGDSFLMLGFLPDAPGRDMPEDPPVIRTLQSGVMSMNARSSARFDLLIPKRAWSAAMRLYTGQPGHEAFPAALRALLTGENTDTAFAAATVSPDHLKARVSSCCAVLVSSLSLVCTPDTPRRMLAALDHTPGGCVLAPVLEPREFPSSILSRLLASGFSLFPPLPAFRPLQRADWPFMLSAVAIQRGALPACAPAAAGCAFVRRRSAGLPALLSAFRRACLHGSTVRPLLPAAQLLLLLFAAVSGSGLLFAAAFLPELPALLRPSSLPCALMRAALLPASAAYALDALLMRATAQTRHLRLRMPPPALSGAGSFFPGALLLAAALAGTYTLPAALPLSLLWLVAPLLHAALHRPTMARIPLSPDELIRLRSEAESACCSVRMREPEYGGIPLRMLCETAACMLRQLEPDEAARRVESLLARYLSGGSPCPSAADQAAMLACAQYLREHMGDCDAALRPLPPAIEAAVLASPLPQEGSRLSAFLRAARTGDTALFTSATNGGYPLEALFLPLAPAKETPPHALTLPLTHPHTYLAGAQSRQKQEEAAVSPGRFLAAAAAALSHPFYPLFMRSPIAAPYAALLHLP